MMKNFKFTFLLALFVLFPFFPIQGMDIHSNQQTFKLQRILDKYPGKGLHISVFTAMLQTLSLNKCLEEYFIDLSHISCNTRWDDIVTFLDVLPDVPYSKVSLASALYTLSFERLEDLLAKLGTNITHLDLSSNCLNRYPRACLELIIQFIEKNRSLTYVDVTRNGIDINSTKPAAVLQALRDLFSSCTAISNQDSHTPCRLAVKELSLKKPFTSVEQLWFIDFSEFSLADARGDFEKIFTLLQSEKTFYGKVSFRGALFELEKSEIQSVLTKLSRKITHLDLSKNALDRYSRICLKIVIDCIKSYESLTCIDISGNGIDCNSTDPLIVIGVLEKLYREKFCHSSLTK